MEGKILAVDDDAINRKLVSATLEKAGYEVSTAKNGLEALHMIEEQRPDVVLLDVMMPEMDGYEVCGRIRRTPHLARTPVMMLTALDTVEEKIKGFEAGADDYLPKPFAPDELLMRVKVLMRRVVRLPELEAPKEVQTEVGKVTAVYSLRGGVGVSSIATNLTVGLSQLWDTPSVLVDLSFNSGQSALMLNLPFRNTWADLALASSAEIDRDLVNAVLLEHASQARVLAASPRPEQNEYLTAEKVTHVINLLVHEYRYLVLDMPHDFSDTTLAGLDAADEIVLVMAPELASVRAMVCVMGVFESLGYDKNKEIRVVLNWTFQRNGLARKDIEAALRREIDLVIPFAPEPMVAGINLGTPPVYGDPHSALGALFEDMSFMLSDEKDRRKRPGQPTEAWNRVVQRIKRQQKR